MKTYTPLPFGLLLSGGLLVVALTGYLVAGQRGGPSRIATGQDPDPTSTPSPTYTPVPSSTPLIYPSPIYDDQDAISRSLALFPAGHNPQSEIARLITHGTLNSWYEIDDEPPPPGVLGPGGWDPVDPVWLFGILGSGLTAGAIIEPSGIPAIAGDDPRPAAGAYYAWDANSGGLRTVGGLVDTTPQNYASLAALPNENVSVVPATDLPVIGGATPTP